MIAGIFHQGSGLGNQLHRYVATRVLAADKRYEFGMVTPEHFKGSEFMTLDMGGTVDCTWTTGVGGEVVPISSMASFKEKRVVENDIDIRSYDPEINFVQDNTILDGEFQDERYFMHRINEVQGWLHTSHLGVPNNLCIIGFRGGEFQHIPELFLPREYWERAIELMRREKPDMRFQCVTDDPETARSVLPQHVKVTHDLAMDWRLVRNARYLIIANSSFYILPALLNWHSGNAMKIIAPRYWARRNTGVWALPQNYYPCFYYI